MTLLSRGKKRKKKKNWMFQDKWKFGFDIFGIIQSGCAPKLFELF